MAGNCVISVNASELHDGHVSLFSTTVMSVMELPFSPVAALTGDQLSAVSSFIGASPGPIGPSIIDRKTLSLNMIYFRTQIQAAELVVEVPGRIASGIRHPATKCESCIKQVDIRKSRFMQNRFVMLGSENI